MENTFAKYNFKDWSERNEKYLNESYEIAINHSKEMLKEDFKYFEIDFKFYSFMVWKSMLKVREGNMFSPYMQFGGIFDLSNKLRDFINEYAIHIVNITEDDKKELMNMLSISNRKGFYKTFYFIYASMLGVENYYFDKMFSAISESDFYKELSETKKNELNDLLIKLSKTNLKSSFYYEDYEKINIDRDYRKDEKDYIYNTFEYDNFDTWEFAFIVLAIRNKDNPHFLNLSLFKDEKDKLDVLDINSLKNFASKFHNNYNTWQYRKNN